jgi:hypothetical protein
MPYRRSQHPCHRLRERVEDYVYHLLRMPVCSCVYFPIPYIHNSKRHLPSKLGSVKANRHSLFQWAPTTSRGSNATTKLSVRPHFWWLELQKLACAFRREATHPDSTRESEVVTSRAALLANTEAFAS